MPPVNTPARSPSSPQTPTHQSSSGRPLTPFSYLSSPAPDLASTLIHTSQAADEADEANVNFLRDSLESLDQAGQQQQASRRTHVDASRDPRRSDYASSANSWGSRQGQQQQQQETSEDLSRRERLQRVLARLNRLHEPSASTNAAYSNRTPSPNRQSLYDWAPARGEEGSMAQRGEDELEAILRELRRQQPETHPDILRVLSQSQLDSHRQRERDGTGGSSGATNEGSDAAERRNRLRERDRRLRESEWVSLRSRAALQRARNEGGGSPSATERMLRYVMDRERSGLSEEEERARGSGWLRPSPTRGGNSNEDNNRGANWTRDSWMLPPPSNEWRDRDRQERVEAFRRGYLAENVPPRLPRISTPPVPSTSTPTSSSQPQLENALKYLSELRSCTRYEEALSTAIDHGLATKEFFAEKHDDFVMDLDDVPPLPYTSWLQPGTVFEGHQHATSGSANLTHQPTNSSSHVEQINPNYRGLTGSFDHPPGSTRVAPFGQFMMQTSSPSPKDPPHDHWPVRVIIHSIDPEKMTLQGTMEAYDVPQHPSSLSIINAADRPKAGKKHKPITTYLEGHIIDLRTHSFLTPSADDKKQARGGAHATSPENSTPYTTTDDSISFPSANSATDAQNWLKLPPFSEMTSKTLSNSSQDSKVSRQLLTLSSLEKLNSEYIFMRWKERCFVHSADDGCTAPPSERAGDQDRGHGLTISGFYYVSLRRGDGVVEGLYFDPTSTPYQVLKLTGRGGGWGAWGFR